MFGVFSPRYFRGWTVLNPGGALQAKFHFWFQGCSEHYMRLLFPCWNRSLWPPLLKANYILLQTRILHKDANELLAEGKSSLLLLFILQQHLGDGRSQPRCCSEMLQRNISDDNNCSRQEVRRRCDGGNQTSSVPHAHLPHQTKSLHCENHPNLISVERV